MSRKFFLTLIIALVGLGVVASFIPSSKKMQQGSFKTPYPTYRPATMPQTTLWLQPTPSAAVDAKGEIPLDIYINTNENKVTAVQLEISYDPSVLQFVSIKGVDLLGGKVELIKKVDEKRGLITFAVGQSPAKKEPSIQGSDEIGKLVFRPLHSVASETEVKILPNSLVSAQGVAESVLVGTRGTKVILTK